MNSSGFFRVMMLPLIGGAAIVVCTVLRSATRSKGRKKLNRESATFSEEDEAVYKTKAARTHGESPLPVSREGGCPDGDCSCASPTTPNGSSADEPLLVSPRTQVVSRGAYCRVAGEVLSVTMNDDTLNDAASDVGSTDSVAPEEAIAKLRTQNQALWARICAMASTQEENSALEARIANLEDQLAKARDHAAGELQEAVLEKDGLKEQIRKLSKAYEECTNATVENPQLEARIVDLKHETTLAEVDPTISCESISGDLDRTVVALKAGNRDLPSDAQMMKQNEKTFMKELESLRSEQDQSQAEVLEHQLKLEECEEGAGKNKGGVEFVCAICQPRATGIGSTVNWGLEQVTEHLKAQNSEFQKKNEELLREMEGLVKELEQMEMQKSELQCLTSQLKVELETCQNRLGAVVEERNGISDRLAKIQQCIEESSEPGISQLKLTIAKLESEVARLAADNVALSTQLLTANFNTTTLAGIQIQSIPATSEQDAMSEHSNSSDVECRNSEDTLQGRFADRKEGATEMSGLAPGGCQEKSFTLSHVQYAGLLHAVVEAMRQVGVAKQNSIVGEADTLLVLDRVLIRSLPISVLCKKPSAGSLQRRLTELEQMMEDKLSCFEHLHETFTSLKMEMQEATEVTLHQDVLLEYMFQQLSSPEKVVRITWQVESLKRCMQDLQREVEALKELNDQQQEELRIQWESKQQALAETRVHHRQVSSVSQQLENLKEATDTLSVEKEELEEELRSVNQELDTVRSMADMGHETSQQQIAQLQNELTASLDRVEQLYKREQVYEEQFAGIHRDVLQAHRFVEQAIQQGVSLCQWRDVLLNVTEQLGGQVQEVLSHHEASERAKGSMEADLEQVKTQLEILCAVKERLGQEKSQQAAQIVSIEAERDSLRIEMQQLTSNLSAANEALASEEHRVLATTSAHANLQKEVSCCQLAVNQHEDKLRASETECQSANEALNKVKEDSVAAALRWKDEVQLLRKQKVPRSKWPATVRELVEQSEEAMRQLALPAKNDDLEVLGQKLETKKDKCGDFQVENPKKIEEARNGCRAAEQCIHQFQGEMKGKEECLLGKLSTLEETAQSRQAELEGQVWDLTECLHSLEEEVEERVDTLNRRLEQKSQELSSLQEESRMMMSEKDNEIHQLKTQVHALSLPSKDQPHLPPSSGGGMDSIPTATQVTSRGLPTDLMQMAFLRTNEAGDSAEAFGSYSVGLCDSRDNSCVMEDSDDDLAPMREAKSRSMVLPPANGIPNHLGGADGNSMAFADKQTEADMLHHEIECLRKQIHGLELDAEDSERTHALRDKANRVLKEEIAELQRSTSRETVDKGYLKNVLVSAFEKGTLPKDSPMVAVLARLLSFSPDEVERIRNAKPPQSKPAPQMGLFAWAGLS